MTSTDLATTFASQIAELGDIPAAGALEPGRIIWLHGAKVGKVPGIFYVKSTDLEGAPGAPWQPSDRFESERETGYSTPQLKVAIIAERSQWFIPGDRDSAQPTTWLRDYQPGSKKLVEYLVIAEGISVPMVLSASGMNKAKPIAQAISDYKRGLLMQASRQVKRQLPMWAFWLPFANKLDSNGKTAYIEATDGSGKSYGSVVTPPALHLPENALDALYVGNDVLRWGAEIASEYRQWPHTRRLGANEVEGEVISSRPALPAPTGRNVPQPLEDSEIEPF